MPGAEWLWEAFQILSERRRLTDGAPDPIAISEIVAYATYRGITAEYEKELLLRILCALDNAFLTFIRKKQTREKQRQSRRKPK